MNNQATIDVDNKADAGPMSPTAALSRFVPSDTASRTDGALDSARAKYGFRIGSIGLTIAGEIGREVIESLAICPLPVTAAWFSGLVNLRGNLVPVFDLHRLFGEAIDDNDTRRLLVIDKGERAIAIPIDDLPRPLHGLEPITQIPPVPASLEDHIRSAAVHDQNLWLEIDITSFFESLGERVAIV